MGTLRCRSVFISDVHLGTRECRADYLLDFLNSVRCEHLYLVGDIFDLWSMRRSVYWTADQSAVLQRILHMARSGTRVTYIPGNHDELFRDFAGSEFHGVQVRLNAEHLSADGRRFFVSHGDEFDGDVRHNALLKAVGDGAYQMLLKGNRVYNAWRRRRGHGYWSLSAWLKTRVGNARAYIRKFEEAAAQEALKSGFDGYICGHIHKAGIERIDGVLYCNDGDWVEHCTTLVEDFSGTMQLLHWSDHCRVEASDGAVEVPVPDLLGVLVGADKKAA